VGNGCDHDQGELELYQPDNVSVSNGHVNLRADKHTVNAVNGKTYQPVEKVHGEQAAGNDFLV
jgi:lipopolysaccharide export system protein LptA